MQMHVAMDRDFKHSVQWAVISFFLVVTQVQALDHARTHSPSRSHDPWTGTAAYRNLWRNPAPWREHFHREAVAAGPRKINAHPRGVAKVTTTGRHDQQKESLLSFKASISGGNMTAFQNWDANDTALTPCDWTGVTCSEMQQVTEIMLGSNELIGNITSALLSLQQLQSLQVLDLSENNFTGFIPGAALLNLSTLVYLDISENQLSGNIPDQIGELSNLQSLVFFSNDLSGEIPLSIINCTMLRLLELGSNLLVGEIPSVIGRLAQLEQLFLDTDIGDVSFGKLQGLNQFAGTIPPSLGNCSHLRELSFALNDKLSGHIPQELSQLRRLAFFNVFGCSLEGPIPPWLGNFTSLSKILMAFNYFRGPIPAGFSKLSNLTALNIELNFLTGDVPPGIANCTSLRSLDVSFNLLSGLIPPGLGNCSSLFLLNLGNNSLHSPERIPPWITSLTQLEYLYLAGMNLQGQIPGDMGSLSMLLYLQLQLNPLSGTIPPSLSNCSFLEDLTLVYSNLSGPIPSGLGHLGNLIHLVLSGNQLTGVVPTSFTNLTQLVALWLDFNSLSGTLDGHWDLLPRLRYFQVDSNHFVGQIPWTLGNCSDLRWLTFPVNNLTGTIPASLANLSQLVNFDVSVNNIGGKVPAGFGRISTLSFISLQSNKLEGTLPPDLGSSPSLTTLYLGDNNFTGPIFKLLGKLTGLQVLDLAQNGFYGSAADFSAMKHLTKVNISHNFFSGSLPASWSNLANIQIINVSANRFSGSMPDVSKLVSLQILDVSHNNLSGVLPSSLASLSDLQSFNASYNDFVGQVPINATLNPNITAASFFGNPGLCGAILGPSRECPRNVSQSESSRRCKSFSCARVWVPTAVAGILFIFLAIAAVAVVAWWMRRGLKKKAARQKDGFDILLKFIPKTPKFTSNDILAVITDKENVIGTGAQSVVYKGTLPSGDVVAIKAFVGVGNEVPDLWRDFLVKEAKIHATLRHRNVVKLIAFCSNADFKVLLLEYMPQGSLDDHLYSLGPGQTGGGDLHRRCTLSWSVRFAIVLDVAVGVAYLHHDCPDPLIHGDMKPSNVLLGDEMVAKVADFGISKLVNLQREEPGEATVSNACGTVGYMPPEYAFVTAVSTKGDVFSYGVLVLEMLSGRSPKDVPAEEEYRSWNLKRFQEMPMEFFDPHLQAEGRADALKSKQMNLLAKIAFFATRESPQSRPSMKDVRSMLLQIRELEVKNVASKTIDELVVSDDEERITEMA